MSISVYVCVCVCVCVCVDGFICLGVGFTLFTTVMNLLVSQKMGSLIACRGPISYCRKTLNSCSINRGENAK